MTAQMTSERGIEWDRRGTGKLMSSMLSSVQLQATGCKFAVFRARERLLGSAKAVPARMHPLPVFRGWN